MTANDPEVDEKPKTRSEEGACIDIHMLLPDVIGYLRLTGNIISPNRRGSRNAERVDALARSSYI